MTRGMVPSRTPEQDKDRWRTPQAVFAMLDKRYGPFTLDAAADETNHKCHWWMGPGSMLSDGDDALAANWGFPLVFAPPMRVFCNPPYSMTASFVRKAKHEVARGHIVSATLLLPATTDVRWFHEYVWDSGSDRTYNGVALGFSSGRIRFERPDGSRAGTPTHGSMFVTFSQEWL